MISFSDIRKGLARGCSRLMNFGTGNIRVAKSSGVLECVSDPCLVKTSV
jgi:hypothetical protein